MAVCVFFGHGEYWEDIDELLRDEIMGLISDFSVDEFLVGNHGRFDFAVRRILKQIQLSCPHIHYSVVLSAVPGKKQLFEDSSDTFLPEGIDTNL